MGGTTVASLLTNGWVVGIGGGVLSGLIVAWLTRVLFSKRDQRELAMKVHSANQEILYAIRPEISEQSLPSIQVIDALRSATARKYHIDRDRLHDVPHIVEDLIKEIMDSSFVSSAAKREYCEDLKLLIAETASEKSQEREDPEIHVARVEYKEKMVTLLSMTLGTIAALATMVSFLSSRLKDSSLFGKLTEPLLPMLLVFGSLVLVMTAMQAALRLRRRKIRTELGLYSDEMNRTLTEKTDRK